MLPERRQPIHPGKILLEEFLKPLGISQEQFSAHLGGTWTQPKVSAIINQRRQITEAIALDFADVFGTNPEFWMNLQTRYDLWHVKKKRRKIPPLPAFKKRREKKSKQNF